MRYEKINKSQEGIALFAALMIIIIFAILGMMNAKKSKDSERMSGGAVRYGVVFESAEQTLRDAVNYISSIPGKPMLGAVSDDTVSKFNGFDTSSIDFASLLANPSKAIIWDRTKLAKDLCGTNLCAVKFENRLDGDVWIKKGLRVTHSTDKKISENSHLKNTETYTIIEGLRNTGGVNAESYGESRIGASSHGGIANKLAYYLVTVKASGFIPGEKDRKAVNSRENVIIQAVFAKR